MTFDLANFAAVWNDIKTTGEDWDDDNECKWFSLNGMEDAYNELGPDSFEYLVETCLEQGSAAVALEWIVVEYTDMLNS